MLCVNFEDIAISLGNSTVPYEIISDEFVRRSEFYEYMKRGVMNDLIFEIKSYAEEEGETVGITEKGIIKHNRYWKEWHQ